MLKGLGALGDLSNVMKQAMEMKGKMEELKEELGNEKVEASAGGGMVTVEISGKLEVLSVKIEPEIIDAEEPEMLETLVQAAVNEAIVKSQTMMKERMAEVTQGLNIPGLNLPGLTE